MVITGLIDNKPISIDLDEYKKEVIALVEICKDPTTDEKTRMILRADLLEIKSEFNKLIAELE